MAEIKEKPNYYAIIPAEVRYADIPAQAKLLFGEITALSNKEGYAWATNSYFAELYNMTVENVSRLFKKLEEAGFIECDYTYDKDNKTHRKILIKMSIDNFINRQKCQGGIDKNVNTGIDKNVKHNNTSINNTSEYKVSKKEAEQMSYNQIIKNYFKDKEMQNTITEFIKMRKLIKKPITNYGLKLICDKLVKEFKDGERIAVLQQSIMNNWQGLYPLKKENQQQKTTQQKNRENFDAMEKALKKLVEENYEYNGNLEDMQTNKGLIANISSA